MTINIYIIYIIYLLTVQMIYLFTVYVWLSICAWLTGFLQYNLLDDIFAPIARNLLDGAFREMLIHTHTMPPWEDQCEWHRMTRMTGPDCAVVCNLMNTHTHILNTHNDVDRSRSYGRVDRPQ